MAKTNHIDSTRPAPISMNEFITVYWLELLHKLEIIYKYFVIQNTGNGNPRNKTEPLVLLK